MHGIKASKYNEAAADYNSVASRYNSLTGTNTYKSLNYKSTDTVGIVLEIIVIAVILLLVINWIKKKKDNKEPESIHDTISSKNEQPVEDITFKIQELAKLRASGAISEEEYLTKKKELLDRL